MIKSISLKNVALYKNEAKIENLNKINFIYGSNGSGKTTLIKLLVGASSFNADESFIPLDTAKLPRHGQKGVTIPRKVVPFLRILPAHVRPIG